MTMKRLVLKKVQRNGIKQITGENSVWGKYRLNFTYDKEGNFLKAWRLNAETGDTTGVITVDYDLNYHFLSIIDYVSQLDPARIPGVSAKISERLAGFREILSLRTIALFCEIGG